MPEKDEDRQPAFRPTVVSGCRTPGEVQEALRKAELGIANNDKWTSGSEPARPPVSERRRKRW